MPQEKCRALLVQAITNILTKCKCPDQSYRIVTVHKLDESKAAEQLEEAKTPSCANPDALVAHLSPNAAEVSCSLSQIMSEEQDFHSRLQVTTIANPEDVLRFYSQNYEVLSDRFGVLLCLYSVILTRGVDNLKSELNDSSEPLIDNTYGYGSQSLINLMLTGSGTAHVFDNFEDVGGMRLQGLSQQSEIGFITLMEQMRYCTVGSFFKNPKSPVWVMGSETHLSVVFSDETKLVSPETACERAKRVFKGYDPDGNNFIQCEVLKEILQTLELVCEDE